MKPKFLNIIPAVLVVLVLLMTTGCKKYLDVQPVSQYDVPQVFSDVSNATTAVVGVYDELQGDAGYGIRISLYYPYDSDEGIVSGNLDNGRRGIGRYQLLLSNAELRNPFLQLYRGIEKANLVIEQIPAMDMYANGTEAEQRDLRRLYGEALTLRAQFLFELMRHWGDVPTSFIPSYKQSTLFIPQANRDSSYDRILADLAIAKDLVPWRTEVPRNERITKGAVKALRARIALFRGGYSLRTESKIMERRSDYKTYYQIARDECAEIIARRDQHTLNPSFEDVWRKVTSFTMDPFGEILFEVGAGGGNANSDSRMGNYDGPSLNAASRYGAGGGGIVILPNYFYSFDTLDTRRDVTITTYQVTGSSNVKSMRRLAELTNGKYRRDWRVPLLPGTVLNPGFNWAIIRFSDVLLMFAEAENEINGPTTAAKTALEEVRKRAFKGNETKIPLTPTDKAAFFDAIVSERYLEFGTEAIRKYDLIRWNLLTTKLQEARTKIAQIRDAAAPYSSVPQYIYWKNNGEEIQFYAASPFYQPTQTPSPTTGWTRLDWRQHLTTNVIDGLPIHQAMARFFTPNKSELFPYDQATMDAYQGKLKQNPNY
ncbi:MAG TPA: RagB/SusD family nutrient uptake outer membrane protein [Flavitalea sp.]|nr:RagB/SusD family nutrient uptake outer membrane protein [Flavitalea sp.]